MLERNVSPILPESGLWERWKEREHGTDGSWSFKELWNKMSSDPHNFDCVVVNIADIVLPSFTLSEWSTMWFKNVWILYCNHTIIITLHVRYNVLCQLQWMNARLNDSKYCGSLYCPFVSLRLLFCCAAADIHSACSSAERTAGTADICTCLIAVWLTLSHLLLRRTVGPIKTMKRASY